MFYEAALEAMRRLNTVADTLSGHTNGLCGELRVTVPVSLTQFWLGDVIADLPRSTRISISCWSSTTGS